MWELDIFKNAPRSYNKTQQNTTYLGRHKLPLALLADLQEGVAGHVLHPGVVLVHKLEQLVHHGLQELPVRA